MESESGRRKIFYILAMSLIGEKWMPANQDSRRGNARPRTLKLFAGDVPSPARRDANISCPHSSPKLCDGYTQACGTLPACFLIEFLFPPVSPYHVSVSHACDISPAERRSTGLVAFASSSLAACITQRKTRSMRRSDWSALADELAYALLAFIAGQKCTV
ncbi:hypothetical protein LIA77_04356 [Sarocladium implicatum]|nr:hypothetical protein LIA77_04356 [Sarocladium implicatum]